MPTFDIASPTTVAPVDRMSLAVGWVRPGATGINGKVDPSNSYNQIFMDNKCNCFEGNEE